MQTKDYYKILELPPAATLKEIKTAYRRLAHQFHPDKNANDLYAATQFELIKEAYEVLSNPSKKEYYLQQRWYDRSMGKKSKATVITPVTVLKQLLELDKYISTVDMHRMDKEGLYSYISDVLSEESIQKLNVFREIEINKAIVETILKCSRPLPYSYTRRLSVKLGKIKTDAVTLQAINQYVQHSRSAAVWKKYKIWLLFLIVMLLCSLIYIISH